MSAILVYGQSGTGKSTAIYPPHDEETKLSLCLNPNETFIICSDKKPLPFAGWKKMYKEERNLMYTKYALDLYNNGNGILPELERSSKVKYVIWDTMTHVIVDKFMGDSDRQGYSKFTELARQVYDILNYIQDMNTNVVVIGHEDVATDARGVKISKIRTIGKLLDEKIEIPSMFTTVLLSGVSRTENGPDYHFYTQSDGTTSAKSPYGMFDYKITNSYKYIFDKIEEYNN